MNLTFKGHRPLRARRKFVSICRARGIGLCGKCYLLLGEVLMAENNQIDEPPHLTSGDALKARRHSVQVLQARHNRLEQQIAEEYQRPLPDTELVRRLKVEKLHLKEQIELVKSD
jgi:hypothetical protein